MSGCPACQCRESIITIGLPNHHFRRDMAGRACLHGRPRKDSLERMIRLCKDLRLSTQSSCGLSIKCGLGTAYRHILGAIPITQSSNLESMISGTRQGTSCGSAVSELLPSHDWHKALEGHSKQPVPATSSCTPRSKPLNNADIGFRSYPDREVACHVKS